MNIIKFGLCLLRNSCCVLICETFIMCVMSHIAVMMLFIIYPIVNSQCQSEQSRYGMATGSASAVG